MNKKIIIKENFIKYKNIILATLLFSLTSYVIYLFTLTPTARSIDSSARNFASSNNKIQRVKSSSRNLKNKVVKNF